MKVLSKIDPSHHETKRLCCHWRFLMYFLRSLLQANKSFIPPSAAPSVHQSNKRRSQVRAKRWTLHLGWKMLRYVAVVQLVAYAVYKTTCLRKGMCHVHFYIWNLPCPNVTVYISHVTAPVAATNPQYLAAMILSNVGGPPQPQNRNALFGGPLSHHWKAWSEYPQCENHLSCDREWSQG